MAILDVDGTTNLDVVDIDGAVDMAAALTVAGTATFTDTVLVTRADNSTQLTLESTDADGQVGPRFDLHRNSASPAASDNLGQIRFLGDDSAGVTTSYAFINSFISNPADGSESGEIVIETRVGGANRQRFTANTTETIINEDGVDLDFRVESDANPHMLFVNGGTSQVVIGGSTSGTYDTLTVNHFGISAANNAGITVDANANSGTGQAALRLLAGSGSTNRAARVDFLNGVVSTTTPQWTILNDYLQDGTNDFNIISGGSDRRLVLTSGSAVFNEIGSDVDFRVESDRQRKYVVC